MFAFGNNKRPVQASGMIEGMEVLRCIDVESIVMPLA